MGDAYYRFGNVAVDSATREVTVGAKVRPMAPKVFDLLVLLIEERHRVVTKDELLTRIWGGRTLTDGVLAQSVARLRRAIDEEPGNHQYIKTIHRIGFRFVGEVVKIAGDDPARSNAPSVSPREKTYAADSRPLIPDAGTPSSSKLKLAFLPFENLTDDPTLDWVKLGLMSLVVNELATDGRLAMVAMQPLIKALAGVPDIATTRADRVVQLLGAKCVVDTQVIRQGTRYCLDYGLGVPPMMPRRRLVGDDLVQLGHRLAVAVEEQLFPSTSACVNEFRSKDPLASLAFARAMQSVAEQKWTLAVNLLQTVLDIEPDNDTVQLQYLTALANAGMETAIPLGQRLLKAAKDEDDIAREAAANLALGQAYYSRRAIQAAEYHLDEALKLGVLLGAPEWLPAAYQFRSTVALFRNDVAKASEYLQRLRDICDESGNQIDLLGWMSVSAWLSTETGDLVRAAQYARTARNLSIKCGLMGELVNSTIRLGDVSAEQGLFGEALEIAEEALDIAMRQGVHFDIVNAATLLAWLNFEVRKSRGIMDVLAQLDEVPDERSLTTLPASPIARAFLAACLRDHSIAAREWRLVISLCEQLGAPLIEHRFVPWLADALTLAGRKEEARLVLEEARERLGSAITILQESSILHSEALQLLMAGHRAQALEWLLRCVEVSQSGEWHSLASIDAAWLSLEEGESLVAKRLTRSLGPWLDEHPAGLVLKARMSFADRFFAAANNAQKRYFNVIQCPPPDYYLRLDELYQAALEDPSTSSLILPLTPSLPSRM